MATPETYSTVKSTAENLIGLLSHRWFLAVTLWALLATQVTALLTERDPVSVLSDVLLDTLHLEFTAPVLDWLPLMLESVRSHTIGFAVFFVVLTLLSMASLYAFWADGRSLRHLVEVDMAPINVMLRLTLLTTVASLFGHPAALWTALAGVIGSYGIGAMTTASPHQRVGAFFAAVMILSVSIPAALFCPVVIAGGRLYIALKSQSQD